MSGRQDGDLVSVPREWEWKGHLRSPLPPSDLDGRCIRCVMTTDGTVLNAGSLGAALTATLKVGLGGAANAGPGSERSSILPKGQTVSKQMVRFLLTPKVTRSLFPCSAVTVIFSSDDQIISLSCLKPFKGFPLKWLQIQPGLGLAW